MRSALYYIFKKNLLVLCAVLVVFAGIKWLVALGIEDVKNEYIMLDSWVEDCYDLEPEQVKRYISELQQEIYTDNNVDYNVLNEFSKFNSSFHNMEAVNNLIEFAKNGEGVLPMILPKNFLELDTFYENIDTPKTINQKPLDIYFELQSYSTVIFAAVFLMAVFFGNHYELGIYRYTVTAKKGAIYNRTVRLCVLFLSMLLLLSNELFDLMYSGLLFNRNILNATIQSYAPTYGAQINARIWQCLGLTIVSKVLGVVIFCHITELIARYNKNMKDTLVTSVFVIVAMFFIGSALDATEYYSLLQIGYVDWKKILSYTIHLPSLGISNLLLGLITTMIIEVVVLIVTVSARKNLK